jgi:type IV secretory pathway protease TraF
MGRNVPIARVAVTPNLGRVLLRTGDIRLVAILPMVIVHQRVSVGGDYRYYGIDLSSGILGGVDGLQRAVYLLLRKGHIVRLLRRRVGSERGRRQGDRD